MTLPALPVRPLSACLSLSARINSPGPFFFPPTSSLFLSFNLFNNFNYDNYVYRLCPVYDSALASFLILSRVSLFNSLHPSLPVAPPQSVPPDRLRSYATDCLFLPRRSELIFFFPAVPLLRRSFSLSFLPFLSISSWDLALSSPLFTCVNEEDLASPLLSFICPIFSSIFSVRHICHLTSLFRSYETQLRAFTRRRRIKKIITTYVENVEQ